MARVRYTALTRIQNGDELIEIGASVELDEADAAPLLAGGFVEPLEKGEGVDPEPAAAKPKRKRKPAAKAKAKPTPQE